MNQLVLALCLALLAPACKKSNVVADGKTVKINYTLKVDNQVMDSSANRGPMPYVQGQHHIIPGLEEEMVGMKVGEKKHVTVAPEKGYGQLDPNAKQKIPKKAFGNTKGLKPGMMVTGSNGGRPIQAKVLEIGKDDITLDFNHPLAGKTLEFDVEVVSVEDTPAGTEQIKVPSVNQPEAQKKS
jgi:FKBP-type peptidyl-prolyl cis-trans isomerase SlyD